MQRTAAAVLAFALLAASSLHAADEPTFTRIEDVIYARKFGSALTLDVFKPKQNPNGAAVVWVVSGGWFSSHESINSLFIAEYLKRGYTVFAVVHGSNPRYTIPDAISDMQTSVRFIRLHAADYGIDPDRIGVTGGSAGGHLSLMLGTAGTLGDPNSKDPVQQTSSRVQAVGCYFPPTDFLNYGKPGELAIGCGTLAAFKAPFQFQDFDPTSKMFVPITDVSRILEIGRQISPFYHVTKDDPPTLIIHGDADKLVPIQQAQILIDKLKAEGVATELVTKPGAVHGWPNMLADNALIADWFDKHLAKK